MFDTRLASLLNHNLSCIQYASITQCRLEDIKTILNTFTEGHQVQVASLDPTSLLACLNIQHLLDNHRAAIFWAKIKQLVDDVIRVLREMLSTTEMQPKTEQPKKQSEMLFEMFKMLFKMPSGAFGNVTKKVTEWPHKLSKFTIAMQIFIDDWKSPGSSAYQKAKALFFLIEELDLIGFFSTMTEAWCSNRTCGDWLETSANIIAMLVSGFGPPGAALFAGRVLLGLEWYSTLKRFFSTLISFLSQE